MSSLGWLAQPAAFPWVALVFGLCIGSFLNVVIHRLPRMMEREWRAQCAELAGQEPPVQEEDHARNLAEQGSQQPAAHEQHDRASRRNLQAESVRAAARSSRPSARRRAIARPRAIARRRTPARRSSPVKSGTSVTRMAKTACRATSIRCAPTCRAGAT